MQEGKNEVHSAKTRSFALTEGKESRRRCLEPACYVTAVIGGTLGTKEAWGELNVHMWLGEGRRGKERTRLLSAPRTACT